MNPTNETPNVTLDKLYILAAEEAATKYNYGEVISKNWLLEKFSIEFPQRGTKKDFEDASFEFLQNMEGFKSIMLEKFQMFLYPVKGVGYEIVYPKYQSDLAMIRLRNTVSTEIKRAINVLTHVNEQHLTQDDIRKRDEHQGKIAALAAFSNKRLSNS